MGLPRAIVPGRVYMITRRCLERRFFLRPDPEINNAFAYCLGAAARTTNVRILFSCVQANHHHTGIVDVDGRLPEFLEHLHKFVAKCGNAIRGRWESFWSVEQTSCVELMDPEDILDKMIYALTNPVKDNLVERVSDWPGLDCLGAIVRNKPIVAQRPTRFFRKESALPMREEIRFERPPGFGHLSHEQWVAEVRQRISAFEKSAARQRARSRTRVLGIRNVLRQHWNAAPTSTARRRVMSPRVAGRDTHKRTMAIERNKTFVSAYRSAWQSFREGMDAIFPAGTYWLRRFVGVLCRAHDVERPESALPPAMAAV